MGRPLGKLDEPPIAEVVCGSYFKPVPGLDPVSLGAFWKTRKNEFPRREFKAPISSASLEGVELNLGPDIGPVRTWLISKDDVFILQVQHDRFYLNWRARQDDYPRFNDWDSNQGLLSQFIREHEAFEQFCVDELGTRLELQGIELSKIDHLERGRHWRDSRDLADVIPMLKPALELAERDPVLAVRLSTPREGGSVDIAIDTILRIAQPPVPAVKLECRRAIRGAMPSSALAATFQRANNDLNDLFRRIIPEDQHFRFQKGWHL